MMRTTATRILISTAIFAVPLTLLTFLGSAFAAPADLRVIVNFMITLVLALAIQAFSGTTGIVTFGHMAFMGVGAYVAAILTLKPTAKARYLTGLPEFLATTSIPFLPTVIIAGAAAAVVAAVLGLVLTRMRESALAMATIGVLVIFFVIFDNWESVTRGNTGISGIPQSTTVFAALIFVILAIAVCRWFGESKIGLQLQASRSDPVASEALGSNVVRLRWLAWTLSGTIMGVGGALWAQFNIAVGPQQFSFDQTLPLLAMLVVGGLASVSGTVVGVIIITIVYEITRRLEELISLPGLTQIVVAVLILVSLNRRPQGLLGRREADEIVGVLRRQKSLRGAQ